MTPQTDELVTEALILALYLKHESVMAGSVYAYIFRATYIRRGNETRLIQESLSQIPFMRAQNAKLSAPFFSFIFIDFFREQSHSFTVLVCESKR